MKDTKIGRAAITWALLNVGMLANVFVINVLAGDLAGDWFFKFVLVAALVTGQVVITVRTLAAPLREWIMQGETDGR